MSPPVTIAVVSWNTCDLLAACLDSMRPEVEAGTAKVWVVDNGSTDGSPEMVKRRFPDVSLVIAEDNLGFGPAVNLAAERTSSPWLVAANADIELSPGALDTLLGVGEADGRVGALAPKLVLPGGEAQHSVHAFPSLSRALAANLRTARLRSVLTRDGGLVAQPQRDTPGVVDWATGAFLLLRREAFDQVGGFDSDQWMYAEDLDICWRLHTHGWTTRYEPSAAVSHAQSAAAADAFGEQMEAKAIGARYRWLARRRGVAHAWAAAGVNWCAAALQLTLCAPLGRRGGNWARRTQEARAALQVHRTGLQSRNILLDR